MFIKRSGKKLIENMHVTAWYQQTTETMDINQTATRLYQQFRQNVLQDESDKYQELIFAINNKHFGAKTIDNALVYAYLLSDFNVTHVSVATRTIYFDNHLFLLKFSPNRRYMDGYNPPHDIEIIDKKQKNDKIHPSHIFKHHLRIKIDELHKTMLDFIFDNINKPIAEIANIPPNLSTNTLWKFTCSIATAIKWTDSDTHKITLSDVHDAMCGVWNKENYKYKTLTTFTISTNPEQKIFWDEDCEYEPITENVWRISGTIKQSNDVADDEITNVLQGIFKSLKNELGFDELQYEYKKCGNVVAV